MRGRKKKPESRAQEIRASLLMWKQTPKSSRPSLRALARELGTSHQLLEHYYDGLEDWQHRERCQRANAEAEEIRARVKETPRQEGETQVSWVRRIWDQCAKFGTRCPDVITEELLQGITTNRKKNLPAIPIRNC